VTERTHKLGQKKMYYNIYVGINCVPIIGDGVCDLVNIHVIAYLPRKENTSSETKEKETF
jgi:hypothetical protein